jgi:hypothetical protein
MIPVTDEPMEGVAFDVQDHTRWTGTIWTGTHGEMISSDLHGAEEPIRWMLETPPWVRDKIENSIILVLWPCWPFYDLKSKLGH